jgi:NAD(P)-dependent dehydrogenase (short-subunit alcohol dehydrogenase family)
MEGRGYFQGKTVLVTGASTGIGRCVRSGQAREWADLVLGGRLE